MIDLGPKAAPAGGRVVAACTPEELVARGTHTGRALAPVLSREPSASLVAGAELGLCSCYIVRSSGRALRRRRWHRPTSGWRTISSIARVCSVMASS